jgi:glyoxylase-like metal-dependent hydrolase (beta-lactamase superfamily II)
MKILKDLLSILGCTLSIQLCGQPKSPALKISHLTGDFYVYTTYNTVNGTPFLSNSMYLVTTKGVVMFDTPGDTSQFQPLLDSIQKRHNKKVVISIATHYHDDRTGGFKFLKNRDIETYSSKKTWDLCHEFKMNHATRYFENDTTFRVGQYSFQTYYGGEGHTRDNIVIWFEEERILYAGCLVKCLESTTLGNIKDANLDQWPVTITRIIERFPKPNHVITGHQSWASVLSLEHTLKLLEAHKVKR